MIEFARLGVLVGLQVIYYLAVGLAHYSAINRLLLHASSILFLLLGTKMSVIGLTGGIACGKSTVVEIFKKLGNDSISVIDCDKIVDNLYRNDQSFC